MGNMRLENTPAFFVWATTLFQLVIPAQAGIPLTTGTVIAVSGMPACTGMTRVWEGNFDLATCATQIEQTNISCFISLPIPPSVIPAKAGIPLATSNFDCRKRDARLHWHDES
jgi:hypothetical protein